MKRTIGSLDYAIGVHGLAILRTYSHDETATRSIVQELANFLAALDGNPLNRLVEIDEAGVRDGYAAWSATYDLPGNPLISVEEPVVRAMIDSISPCRALDAACGTGRHTRYLLERGFAATGLDCTPEMLALARERLPSAPLLIGDLGAVPFCAGSFDLTLCALALDHAYDLRQPFIELARVTRPGGWIIMSTFHPMNGTLGGGGFYRDANGARGVVRGPEQTVSEYVMAALGAGLEIRECAEPVWTEKEIAMLSSAVNVDAEVFRRAIAGLPCALVMKLAKPQR